ncbi:RNA pseudouridylate synthase domain-containing protein 4 [Thelohanellus kitauei]|uniref:Pseudouridylate synthase RPUSD4, mitochondrial n=1 Tax=Thelohanellus kitauei TaxID=669202 RepID=A0A0C2N4V0_THEKT|nr:RNA pseudouridylate synthase domain-containing protein 4 [Thelohanellus kitauei]
MALDKPCYIPLKSQNPKFPSIENFLPHYSQIYNGRLQVVTRSGIGNNMSGVVLLSKNPQTYDYFLNIYNNSQITEKYIVILTSEPKMDSGTIQVPIRPMNCEKRKMMCAPDCSIIYQNRELVADDVLPAISDFKVVSMMRPPPTPNTTVYKNYFSRTRACVCVFHTSTCFRDQIRVHCSEILGCHILGDHKYSANSNKPQVLSKFMMKMLKLENLWNVKNLPVFIHLSQISFRSPEPPYKQIVIKSPLPEYFTTCVDLLQIPHRNYEF